MRCLDVLRSTLNFATKSKEIVNRVQHVPQPGKQYIFARAPNLPWVVQRGRTPTHSSPTRIDPAPAPRVRIAIVNGGGAQRVVADGPLKRPRTSHESNCSDLSTTTTSSSTLRPLKRHMPTHATIAATVSEKSFARPQRAIEAPALIPVCDLERRVDLMVREKVSRLKEEGRLFT